MWRHFLKDFKVGVAHPYGQSFNWYPYLVSGQHHTDIHALKIPFFTSMINKWFTSYAMDIKLKLDIISCFVAMLIKYVM